MIPNIGMLETKIPNDFKKRISTLSSLVKINVSIIARAGIEKMNILFAISIVVMPFTACDL